MQTRIIVDSTSDLIPAIRERVTVVPMSIRFGDEEYWDGVTIDHKTFYEKLIETDEIPTTSQATPTMFAERYEEVQAAGDEAVVITVSSGFSGTYNSALVAAKEYEHIYVVDGGSLAIGGGILVEQAIRYLDAGLSACEIAKRLEEDKGRIVVVALLGTLEYLKRGGRISKTVAFAGALLNIKPVISIVDGKIRMLGKARGSKQGNNLLVQEIEKAGGVDFEMPVLLGYTGISDTLLKKYMEDSKYLWENAVDAVQYTTIGSAIGTHAGPDAVAVAFFQKEG